METLGHCLRWYVPTRRFMLRLNYSRESDIGVYFAVVVGPVAGRFAIQNGEAVSPPNHPITNQHEPHP